MFPDFSQLDKLGKDLTEFMDSVKADLKLLIDRQAKISLQVANMQDKLNDRSYKEVNHD